MIHEPDRRVAMGPCRPLRPPDRPTDVSRPLADRSGLLALTRSPLILVIAAGALWTSVLAARGPATSLVCCWLWLTLFFVARRAVKQRRPTHPGHVLANVWPTDRSDSSDSSPARHPEARHRPLSPG